MNETAYDVGEITCAEETCTLTIKNHYWGKVKADGWFFQKPTEEHPDGLAWCPWHNPPWVVDWQAKRLLKQAHPNDGLCEALLHVPHYRVIRCLLNAPHKGYLHYAAVKKAPERFWTWTDKEAYNGTTDN